MGDERMHALQDRFRGIFAWLTLYLIPMCVLVPVAAIFLVDRSSSAQWDSVIRDMFGQPPIYGKYSHALSSLRLIPMLGLAVFFLVLLAEMIVSSLSRVSVGFHLLGSWFIGFVSSFGLWYLRWIRIRPEGRTPLMTETGRAIVFGLAYAVIAYIAVRSLRRIWIGNTQPDASGYASKRGDPER